MFTQHSTYAKRDKSLTYSEEQERLRLAAKTPPFNSGHENSDDNKDTDDEDSHHE